MNYWIQRADFETRDLEAPTAAQLASAFQQHDWSSELALQSELEAQGREWCPPGFGLVPGDGRTLHLCPAEDGSLQCHYQYFKRSRLLGLFPRNQRCHETWNDSGTNAQHVIYLFFEQRHEDLLDHLRRAT